jgi:hypothetical protein
VGLFVAAPACGGTTSEAGESGASTPFGADGGGGGGPCTVAGTYSQHFSVEPGGTNCPILFDQTITITPKAAASGTHDLLDASSDCSWNVDPTQCMITTSCSVSFDGFTSTASGSVTFDGGAGAGKETVELLAPNGDVISSCVYDITMSRQ